MRGWMRFAAWALAAALFVGVACAAQLGLGAREVEILLDDAGCAATGAGVEIDGGTVAVRAAGVYRVRGALSNGCLLVKANGDSEVRLILDGAELSSATGPAILVENAGQTILELAEGSANRVRSGAPAEISAGAVSAEAEGGAILARDDLRIEGAGGLAVEGYVNNGIHCSNRLRVSGGEIDVKAVNNGVKGKDGVAISGGNLRVRSGGDGIEADSEDGGAIAISGGSVTVESDGDGAQAATALTVSGGSLRVTSGGGSAAAEPRRSERSDRFGGGNWDRDEASDAPSAKGLKAGTALTISGGSLRVDAADDALHSDGALTISGGAISLASGDDGAHADDDLAISGGELRVSASYEGIEANQVFISGGEIELRAEDDGVNACGGANSFGPGGLGPRGPRGAGPGGVAPPTAEAGPLPALRITGGSLRIDAEGDGLDSNGDLIVEGGTVAVDGPSRAGNGALDSGSESGGACRVDGGTVLAIGASGMAERFDAESGQCSLSHGFASALPAGSEIRVLDASGAVLATHTAAKGFSSVVFSCPALKRGERYLLCAGDERVEIAMDANSVESGERSRAWR